MAPARFPQIYESVIVAEKKLGVNFNDKSYEREINIVHRVKMKRAFGV